MDKISIVIPVYNTKKEYLKECIESVIKQNYDNMEVLMIDDGSKIEISEICDKYSIRDSRIKVIHKRNEGVSVARNKGIEEASGKWILFLDSDDWLEKDCLEKIEIKNDIDILFFKCNIHENENIKISDSWYVDSCEFNQKETEKFIRDILINNDYSSTLGMATSKLYKLSFLRKHDIKFPVGVTFREDSMFNILVFKNYPKIFADTRVIYNYRINELSVTQKKDTRYIENNEKLLNVCKRILEGKYMSEYYAFVIWQLNWICIKDIFLSNEKNSINEVKKVLKNNEYMEAVKNVNLRVLSSRKKFLVLFLRIRQYFLLKFLY